MKPLVLLFVVTFVNTCQSAGHYVNLLTGLKSQITTKVPDDIHNVVSKLTQLERSELVKLMESSDILEENTQIDAAKNQSMSETCLNQTAQTFMGIITGQGWALQMIDAAGKPGSNLMQFQLNFLGSYEECIAVRAKNALQGVTSQLFKGKYCKATLPFTQTAPIPGNAGAPVIGLGLGICLPDSCSGEDVTLLLNSSRGSLIKLEGTFKAQLCRQQDFNLCASITINEQCKRPDKRLVLETVLRQLNVSIPFRFAPTQCQEENREWSSKAAAVFAVAMVFVAAMFVGTVYDIVYIQLPKMFIPSSDSESLLNGGSETSLNIKHHLDESAPLLDPEKKMFVQPTERSVCGKVLLSFSVYTNGSKLLSTKQSPGTLTAVHGIRFLSMSWVILGHNYVFGIQTLDNLASYYPDVIKRFTFQAISNATVSVDSFFTLSGLLVTYLVLKEMKKLGPWRINWFMFYFHRFWRLTPPYMLLLMVYVPLFPYFHTGPLWPQAGVEINECEESWWTNLLYINNLVRKDKMCMAWSWYLANDMQFFILSPLIFVPLFFSGVIGSIVVMIFLLVTMTTAGVISRVNNMAPGLVAGAIPAAGGANATNATADAPDTMAYFYDYYITPWCRMGPYIVGMMAGYILYKTDCKIRLSKWHVIGGWCTAIASALAVVYGLYDLAQGHSVSVDVAAFYNAVHRSVWAASLCWVIFACATGYGGFVNTLLSWPAFIPLSRLTYCAYLVHPIVMYYYYDSTRVLLHITDINAIYWFLGNMVLSYMAAFVVSMAFEAPTMGLEKVFLKREKKD